jgi:protein SERAC1
LIARGASEDYVSELLSATYGIIFMGTPHAGSDLARWGKIVSGLGNLLHHANSEIVAVLKPGSEMLQNVQEEFHLMQETRSTQGKSVIKIFCFYEEIPVFGVGEVCLFTLF